MRVGMRKDETPQEDAESASMGWKSMCPFIIAVAIYCPLLYD
jgi:hypothetical protein